MPTPSTRGRAPSPRPSGARAHLHQVGDRLRLGCVDAQRVHGLAEALVHVGLPHEAHLLVGATVRAAAVVADRRARRVARERRPRLGRWHVRRLRRQPPLAARPPPSRRARAG
eukprot:5124623-Prymnesium_polylepis.1